jgi:hypothetical protein
MDRKSFAIIVGTGIILFWFLSSSHNYGWCVALDYTSMPPIFGP